MKCIFLFSTILEPDLGEIMKILLRGSLFYDAFFSH
jgi:hypothetical protein